jgi:hypothetical protein
MLRPDRIAIPVDALEWGVWFSTADRRVATSHLTAPTGDRLWVSTVFMGIDHAFGGGDPLLFETMVFGRAVIEKPDAASYADAIESQHYGTWDEAERGHAEMVRMMLADGCSLVPEPAASER